ncbi:MAG: hypothetical protein M1300_10770 [Epsilonproteobacteria bacterium]|nr:hypothetical protein [Campylobacterota bacterium]
MESQNDKEVMFNKLYSYHLKLQTKAWENAKDILKNNNIISAKQAGDSRYIEVKGEVRKEADPEIGIEQLIAELSSFNLSEDFPRSACKWHTYGYDTEGPFSPSESGLVMSYKTYCLADFTKAENIAKSFAKHDLFDIEHERPDSVKILEAIGYKELAGEIRGKTEAKRLKANEDHERIKNQAEGHKKGNAAGLSPSAVKFMVQLRNLLEKHNIRDNAPGELGVQSFRQFVGDDVKPNGKPEMCARQYIVPKTSELIADLDLLNGFDYRTNDQEVIFLGPTIEAVDTFIESTKDDGPNKTLQEAVFEVQKLSKKLSLQPN